MNKLINKYLMIMILFGVIISSFSCKYETDYKDTEYPDQQIYMPAAAIGNNLFVIDDISRIRGEAPWPGNPYRYEVDGAQRKFIVPLSVYRSGINNKGAFTVDIKVNNDTIAILNETRGDAKYLLIPSDKYSLVNSVEMIDGATIAQFDLIVDLDFLRDNYPDKIFALGIEISSAKIPRNRNRSIAVIIIHTKIIKPKAGFDFSVDVANSKNVFFNNTSLMSINYQWNFGDGSSTISDYTKPERLSHVYSSAGTYTVTLTSIGITGDQDKSIKSEVVTVD